MTPVDFLKAVWPTSGFYCLATIFKTPEGKAVYSHKVFDTIDEAAAFAARHKNEDIYFCVHSLKEKRVWNEKKKNWKTGELGAWEYRKQSNMQEASTFFFDLDVGAGDQKYASQRDALLALKKFIVDADLPYPMVTSSGGGLHVYWIVDTSLISTEWVTTAARLKALANHHGLKADPARTTDIASVLRVAGTFNMKDKSNPREVEVLKSTKPAPLDEFLKRVNDAVIRAGVTPESSRKKTFTEVDDYFGGVSNMERESDFPPVKFVDVLKTCPMMVDLTRRAAELGNPEWYNGLGVVAFCDNGRALAHKWSTKYASYDYNETDAKIDQQLQFQPVTCKKLQDVCGAEKCTGCKVKGQVKNPLMAARMTAEAPASKFTSGPAGASTTVEVPPPPKPYKILKSGQVVRTNTLSDGDEETVVIYDYPLYPLRRLRNDGLETEQLMWRVEHKHDGVKEFVLDGDALTDSRKLGGALINKGSIYVEPDNLGMLRQYMTAYIRELQRQAKADTQHNQLGWNDDQTEFTTHDKTICMNGVTRPALLSAHALNAADGIGKKGTMQRQVELLEFFNRPEYVANQAMILLGLGAPIFYATGFHGAIINATGEAGASKSTSIYTAASFWAEPELYTINGMKEGATARGRATMLGTLASLPVCIDELTKTDAAEIAQMAFTVSQPRAGKIRLNPDGTLRAAAKAGAKKATVVLATSNASLQGLLAQDGASNSAGAMRVIEMYFANPRVHQTWEAEEYLIELKKNYGHIGEAFIRVWLADKEANERRVREIHRQLSALGKMRSAERFWFAVFSVILSSCEIANREGWLKFDIAAIRRWLLEVQLPRMRGVLSQEFTGPVGLLTDYLSQISGDMVVTDKMNHSVDTVRKPRGPLLAHYHQDKNIVWVLRAGFRDYCQKRKMDYLTVLDELSTPRVSQLGQPTRIVPHVNVRKTLGVGTDFAGGQAWVFEIDMAHPEISGVLPVVKNEKPDLSPSRADLKVVKKD